MMMWMKLVAIVVLGVTGVGLMLYGIFANDVSAGIAGIATSALAHSGCVDLLLGLRLDRLEKDKTQQSGCCRRRSYRRKS